MHSSDNKNNNNNNNNIKTMMVLSSLLTVTTRVHPVHTECRTAPDGCRPLGKAHGLEP